MTREIIVLLREPEPEVSYYLAAILRSQGHHVRTTVGGTSELEKIHSNPPALILLPARMAEITGFELCRRFRRHDRTQHIPLLFVSGDVSEQAEAYRSGASDVIAVPLQPAEVLARVQAYLDLALVKTGRPGERHHLPVRANVPPEVGNDDGWIRLAMQAGRMYAFEWNVVTDTVRRSHDSAAILGIDNDSSRDTAHHFFRLVHPDDRERLQQILSILSPAYDMYDTQFRVLRPDGKVVSLRESGRGLFDAEGRLTRVIGVTADATEQVAARDELEQNQADLHQLIQRLPVAVALTNDQGRIEYINYQFTRDFGYGIDEIAEPAAWWERACPNVDYRRKVIRSWANSVDSAVRQDKNSLPREYLITAKDGTKHSVEVFGAVVAKKKLILFHDVTERKRAEASLRESEERFRVMADTAPVMLWVSGTDKLCTFFSKGWLLFTGRKMEQEVGNGWAEGVHPDDLDRCLEVYTTAFDKREIFQMEYRLRRADGEYRWILDTGTPRFASDGEFLGYIGSGVDVTDLKRRQEQMLVAQRLESLGLLAGGVAHDFNNLLGCILANADVTMAELEINSPARDGLERIEAVVVRASQIVRQIMTYIGEEQADLEPVDLSRLVHEMAQLLRVCIPKRARLNIDLPPSLLVPRANAAQLRQVLMNLIINAGEAIGDRDGVISVTGTHGSWLYNRLPVSDTAAPEGGFVCLEISDTGAGMSQDVLQRIFEPFFSTKVAGRGFGLTAVQTIVRSHGGNIEVSSTPGKGATFRVRLPSSTDLPVRVPVEAAAHERFSRQGSVLIVEDEETLRVSVAKMLSKKGFSVLEAADGVVAVNLIHDNSKNIALVLLDLSLPGKSSQEVFAELQRFRPGVKVILTSAYGRESVAGPLTSLEPETFIRKPYHLNELVTVVRQALPLEAASPVERTERGAGRY
jgi:PAS domain S-box-containing protein